MKVLDNGHLYELQQLGGGTQPLRFVKRSGGAVQYEEEWAGVQTQEVLRVLIHRTKYLNAILPCDETGNAIWHLQQALFEYEARAYRRKREKANRKETVHDSGDRPRAWRSNPYDDVPFNEIDIEERPVGEDGHILINPEL